MSFLQLSQLEKTYDDGTKAVKGVDLDIEEGEFVVLLGPSGCGKTTTLRMIAGLEIATAGQIKLQGHDMTLAKPSQRDIGMVFQFYALYPHMTVEQNLRFPLDAQKTARVEQDAILKPVIERLHLEHLLKRYPRQLSGGDQQRVSLGRALVRKPQIFLMDEPLGTLDADQRMQMREFIKEQQQALGVTTIYVTHDQEEAMSLADRVVVMSAGEIKQNASPQQVYEEPSDTFVANFVGSPGMNLFSGRFDAQENCFVSSDDALSISLTDHRAIEKLQDGEELSLGIRSEYIDLVESNGLDAELSFNEYLGHCRYAHMHVGGQPCAMRVSAEAVLHEQEQYNIRFKPEHVLLYDKQGRLYS